MYHLATIVELMNEDEHVQCVQRQLFMPIYRRLKN